MKRIELERWELMPEDPRRLKYIGQPKAEEIYKELRYALESQGCLPDEYFLMGIEWERGREIPREADIFCTVDYGESEGIYLDIYLKWYENNHPVIRSFITGKTLKESGNALDRMFLTASVVTKAFHGDHPSHNRYRKQGEEAEPDTKLFSFNEKEQQILIKALMDNWKQQKQTETHQDEERLLRRMTGSITEYINLTGQIPRNLSAYDRAVLAVRDGNMEMFRKAYPGIAGQAAELLEETAGRPGPEGYEMTALLLSDDRQLSQEDYLCACKKAAGTGDLKRVLLLVENAGKCVENLAPAFYGAVVRDILLVYPENGWIADELFKSFTSEQKEAAPPDLLLTAAAHEKEAMIRELIENGIHANMYAAEIIQRFQNRKLGHLTELFTAQENCVSIQNFSALYVCMKTGAEKAAENLLERGMDLEKFNVWTRDFGYQLPEDACEILKRKWESLQAAQNIVDAPKMSGQEIRVF